MICIESRFFQLRQISVLWKSNRLDEAPVTDVSMSCAQIGFLSRRDLAPASNGSGQRNWSAEAADATNHWKQSNLYKSQMQCQISLCWALDHTVVGTYNHAAPDETGVEGVLTPRGFGPRPAREWHDQRTCPYFRTSPPEDAGYIGVFAPLGWWPPINRWNRYQNAPPPPLHNDTSTGAWKCGTL